MSNVNDDNKDEYINIKVKMLNGEIISIPNKVNINETTVLKLKEIISNICNIPVNEIRLVWRERILSNNEFLIKNYNLENDSTLILARAPSRNSSGNNMLSNSSNTNNSLFENNLFNSSGEDFLSSAIASPWMQNILSDPEIFRIMLDSNPQLKTLREQNPELNHIFNDPQFLQMSVDVLKNPELMKEMMRNSDRAISNIESIPGGFSALKKMYHTVQEPMWDAALYNPNNNSSKIYNQYNIDKTSGPNSEALPNPWKNGSSDNLDHIDYNMGIRKPFNLFPFDFNANATDLMNTNNGNNNNRNLNNTMNINDITRINNNDDNLVNRNSNNSINHGSSSNENDINQSIENNSNNNNNDNNQLGSQITTFVDLYSTFNNNSTIKNVIDAMRNMDINNTNLRNDDSSLVNNLSDNVESNLITSIAQSNIGNGLDNLLNMFNSNNSIPTNNNVNSGANNDNISTSRNENYNYQLEVLSNMGFTDTEACIKALSESDGSINRAIDKLLNPN